MPLERAEILIKDGMGDAFAATMHERGLSLLRSVPGVNSVQFGRGIENPDKFMLLVDWVTLDAHAAFKSKPIFGDFLQVIGPFSKGGSMEHFAMS